MLNLIYIILGLLATFVATENSPYGKTKGLPVIKLYSNKAKTSAHKQASDILIAKPAFLAFLARRYFCISPGEIDQKLMK